MAADSFQIRQSELYAGYWNDVSSRMQTSSGGIVSCILDDLLTRGVIQGALVSRITSVDGKVNAVTTLAKTREDILQNAGSSYIDTPVLEKIKELKDTPGRFAVVALPCQIRAIRAMTSREPELGKKFSPIIGLFCRGNVNPLFYEDYFKLRGIETSEIDQVKILRGHTSGSVLITMKGGSEKSIPFMSMNTYRLAGVHAKALCSWCSEHMSEEADISVGDIFSKEYKQKPIKYSAFIPRSAESVELISDLIKRGKINCEYVGLEAYKKEFARIERYSDSLAPRYLAAKIAGTKAPKTKPEGKVNFFHVFAWAIYFRNSRLSQSEKGRRRLFSLPSKLISGMAFLIKGLSRL